MMKPAIIGAALSVLAACASQPAQDAGVASNLASPCQSRAVEIYFDDQQDALSPAADTALRFDVASALTCRVVSVRVVGLADALTGTAESNQALSQRRADRVAARITELGVPAGLITTEALGQEDAMTGSIERPLRRRTHIEFSLSDPA
ncbi:Peptidoglycan-associated lipoprotein [Brevundimonas subvibrioides]|uniref:OmpA family protein n=1 Tax=Brevundimonas subvibrioides TaxID=74313 RepID=UPI0032D574FC